MTPFGEAHPDHAAWMNSHESRPPDWKPRHEREGWDLPGNRRTTKPMNRPTRDILIFVMGLLAGLGAGKCVFGQTPASELRAAGRDLMTLQTGERPFVRYLSLYAVENKDELEAVTNYTLNTLSRLRSIGHCTRVSDTLLRVRIYDYAQSKEELSDWTKAWDRLAQDDPYWHIQTQVAEANNVIVKVNSPLAVANPKKLKTVTVEGGWTDLNAAQRLRLESGSFGAILRADWFVANALVAPRYYEFVGIPEKEADFQKSLGIDPVIIAKLRAQLGANLSESVVTKKERRVLYEQGPLGGYWDTLDVAETTAAKSFIRRPVSAEGFEADYDASEIFAMAPNGTFRLAVFNRQGVRQDAVLDKIAKDDSDPHCDGIIHVGSSCLRCHIEGLRPFTDKQQKLLYGRVGLVSYDPGIPEAARGFYNAPRLLRQMKIDVEVHADAVHEATRGLTIRQSAEALANVIRNHDLLPVTKAQACREIGIMPEHFSALVANLHDPFLHLLDDNDVILRGQFTASFPVLALAAESSRR